MQILTGFDPFGGSPVNPSYVVAQQVAQRTGAHCVQVPTRFDAAWMRVERAIREAAARGDHVTSVLLLGQAAGEPGVRLESRALPRTTSCTPDNAGVVRTGPIEAGLDAPLLTRVDLPALMAALCERHPEVPAHVSHDAGGYVCNYLYHRAMRAHPHVPVLFVHLDGTAEMLGLPPRGALVQQVVAAVSEISAWLESTSPGASGTTAT